MESSLKASVGTDAALRIHRRAATWTLCSTVQSMTCRLLHISNAGWACPRANRAASSKKESWIYGNLNGLVMHTCGTLTKNHCDMDCRLCLLCDCKCYHSTCRAGEHVNKRLSEHLRQTAIAAERVCKQNQHAVCLARELLALSKAFAERIYSFQLLQLANHQSPYTVPACTQFPPADCPLIVQTHLQHR